MHKRIMNIQSYLACHTSWHRIQLTFVFLGQNSVQRWLLSTVATKDPIPVPCQGVSVDDYIPYSILISCQGTSKEFEDPIPVSCQGVSVDDYIPDLIPVSRQGTSEEFEDPIPVSCQGVSVDDYSSDSIPVSCQGTSEEFKDSIPVSSQGTST